MTNMLHVFHDVAEHKDLVPVERLDLEAHVERRLGVPEAFTQGAAGRWLNAEPMLRRGLWQHQALALRAIAADKNVVLATGTASGKSLVFQAAALRDLDLDEDSRAVVFYPLKALAADQLVSWRAALKAANLSPATVARVDGDTLADERLEALDRARIVIMTPDVCHAWLMSNLTNPTCKRFLARLRLVIIDEAHVLEAVFGSNFAFLFRRLQAARNLCITNRGYMKPLRVIAASATIVNPAGHLAALTGLHFVEIGEASDGAPRHPRSLLHLTKKTDNSAAGADLKDEKSLMVTVAAVQHELVESSETGSFLTFVDSRQGAERLAIATEAKSLVRPYRSGYEARDRGEIEAALRAGSLRGVVSTSALELGINIPHFAVGLNIGVPNSRKSFRQRLGRVGRTGPGVFAVVAEPYAFRRYGMTLAEYYKASVEPSHLYLHNRFMQFAHARCLAEELEMLGAAGRKAPPADIDWPSGFAEVYEYARVRGGQARPREFDHVAQIGGDAPHYSYPMRNVAETSFVVAAGGANWGCMSHRVGFVTLQQAIRETYPGALYLHLGKGYRVHGWRSTAWERAIRVGPSRSRAFTRPLLRTFVNISVERESLVEGHFRQGAKGFLAECQLQITERVEGFVDRGERRLYRDLRQENPAMTTKTREFRTTGVVLRITSEWFAERGLKQKLAEIFRDILLRELSISPQDVDCVATNIALLEAGKRYAISDAIVIYDATHGSLRLTEPVYVELERLITRLERAADLMPEDGDGISSDAINNLKSWYAGLGPNTADGFFEMTKSGDGSAPDGWLQVYAPGSIVGCRDIQQVLRDIEIIGPMMADIESGPELFYQYKSRHNVQAMAAANKVERVGDDWSFVLWKPTTGEFAKHEDELIEGPAAAELPILMTDAVTPDETSRHSNLN